MANIILSISAMGIYALLTLKCILQGIESVKTD